MPPRSPRSLLLPIVVMALCATGCLTESAGTNVLSTTPLPTSIYVDPQDFLGDVACDGRDGAMKSYIATLVDRTQPEAPITLPWSPPTSCTQPVYFRYVTAEHVYDAKVKGYEELADTLVPAGGVVSGNGNLKDKAAIEAAGGNESQVPILEPRWVTDCITPTSVNTNGPAPVLGCLPLDDRGSSPTGILVDPNAALGGAFACTPSGDVSSFSITPEDPSFPAQSGIACGGTGAAYETNVTPGVHYRFTVRAYLALSPLPFAEASCLAIPEEGVITKAVCDPLTAL